MLFYLNKINNCIVRSIKNRNQIEKEEEEDVSEILENKVQPRSRTLGGSKIQKKPVSGVTRNTRPTPNPRSRNVNKPNLSRPDPKKTETVKKIGRREFVEDSDSSSDDDDDSYFSNNELPVQTRRNRRR